MNEGKEKKEDEDEDGGEREGSLSLIKNIPRAAAETGSAVAINSS